MKRAKLLALPTLLLSLIALDPVPVRCEPAGRNLIPLKQNMSFVSLENLDAEYFPANRVVAIKGSIKNISNTTLRGYITLYLRSSSGMVVGSYDLPVNEHRPFGDGETVSFDTAVNVSNTTGAAQVSVEFTKD